MCEETCLTPLINCDNKSSIGTEALLKSLTLTNGCDNYVNTVTKSVQWVKILDYGANVSFNDSEILVLNPDQSPLIIPVCDVSKLGIIFVSETTNEIKQGELRIKDWFDLTITDPNDLCYTQDYYCDTCGEGTQAHFFSDYVARWNDQPGKCLFLWIDLKKLHSLLTLWLSNAGLIKEIWISKSYI